MIQDQLVEYVSSQMKAGVSREAIKAALTGVGWLPNDVEDTLKKVEGAGAVAPASNLNSVKPISFGTSPASAVGGPAKITWPVAASQPLQKTQPQPVAQPQTQPQSIRMSDLVSATPASPSIGPRPVTTVSAATTPAASSSEKSAASFFAASKKMQPLEVQSFNAAPKHGRGTIVIEITETVIIIVLAALAGFLYWQNTGLSTRVSSLSSESSDVASNLLLLNNQVQALMASNTALTAQGATLAAQNTDLLSSLSFVVVPAGVSAAGATSTVSVSGMISASGKSPYTLTTASGVAVYVSNAKEAKVVAVLAPFVGNANTVQLTGTHVIGSQYLTVTAVNGTAL